MDDRYIEYILQDRWFYDLFEDGKARGDRVALSSEFRLPSLMVPPEWNQFSDFNWHYYMSPVINTPAQGWKIHISATLSSAEEILNKAAHYCFEHEISFKHLKSQGVLLRSNMKYAPRSGSGKFVTIYPRNAEHANKILEELDSQLSGYPGPYILSDLRYKDGPLYLRYGGFKKQYVKNDRDELVPAICDDMGNLVPDVREPRFYVPKWVQKPEFVLDMERALGKNERPSDFPYHVVNALHFSNGGGVYLANPIDEPETKVVIKEGRPYAGLSPDLRDAVSRLENEYNFLQKLDGCPGTVKAIEKFNHSGHLFLVEEFIEGKTLNKAMVERMPLIKADCTPDAIKEYRNWVLGITRKIEKIINSYHERGVVFGDVHPNNIIISDDGEPVFIDFESSSDVSSESPQTMGAPGYVASDGRTGISTDLYALGCLKIAMFIPLTTLFNLDVSKPKALIRDIKRIFDLPLDYCEGILRNLDMAGVKLNCIDEANAQILIELENKSILSVNDFIGGLKYGVARAAQLSRTDRIFPGDPQQFSENALALSYGAAGVIETGCVQARTLEASLDWISGSIEKLESPNYGLYDGLAGIGLTCRRFGRKDASNLILEQILKEDLELSLIHI